MNTTFASFGSLFQDLIGFAAQIGGSVATTAKKKQHNNNFLSPPSLAKWALRRVYCAVQGLPVHIKGIACTCSTIIFTPFPSPAADCNTALLHSFAPPARPLSYISALAQVPYFNHSYFFFYIVSYFRITNLPNALATGRRFTCSLFIAGKIDCDE